ncbi:MAG: DsbC family protein [Gammaproteobacteria bacterium]
MLFGMLSMPLSADDNQQVRDSIKNAFPSAEITRIRESAVPGLYEVLLGTEVVYATGDGQYMLQGDLIDLRARTNVSEGRRTEVRRDIINTVPLDKTVTFPAQNRQYDIYVFTDTSCGYCRKLHRDVGELNRLGVSVHYLAFPRAGIDSQDYYDMEAIWCSSDKQQAMTTAKSGGQVKAGKCANPVREQYELGKSLGVTGTPAIYLRDGRVLRGYRPPQAMLRDLGSG